jgi:hypothetical protein
VFQGAWALRASQAPRQWHYPLSPKRHHCVLLKTESYGILFYKYGFQVIYDARSRIDAKLSSVMRGRDWHWIPARSDALVSIQSNLPLVKIGMIDKLLWLPFRNLKHSCKNTWEAIRVKQLKVEWSKLVWFSFAIPCHAFFLWLPFCDGLATGDRLLRLGMAGDMKCYFLRSNIEGRDHLFFFMGKLHKGLLNYHAI